MRVSPLSVSSIACIVLSATAGLRSFPNSPNVLMFNDPPNTSR